MELSRVLKRKPSAPELCVHVRGNMHVGITPGPNGVHPEVAIGIGFCPAVKSWRPDGSIGPVKTLSIGVVRVHHNSRHWSYAVRREHGAVNDQRFAWFTGRHQGCFWASVGRSRGWNGPAHLGSSQCGQHENTNPGPRGSARWKTAHCTCPPIVRCMVTSLLSRSLPPLQRLPFTPNSVRSTVKLLSKPAKVSWLSLFS